MNKIVLVWSSAETHMWFDWLWIGFDVAAVGSFAFVFSINAEQVLSEVNAAILSCRTHDLWLSVFHKHIRIRLLTLGGSADYRK